MTKNKQKPEFERGDWIVMKFGFEKLEWYVLESLEDNVKLGQVVWCVSSAMWFSIDELNSRNFYKVGPSKMRWWWKFLPWRNSVCPFNYHQN